MTHSHRKVRRSCRTCTLPGGPKHDSDNHRFHGRCSFKRTHIGYCRRHRCGCQK